MSKILFVEKSATLRHVLGKTLRESGFSVEALADFALAQQALEQAPAGTYQGLILGWPDHTEYSSDEFLSDLVQAPHTELAVLILADSPDSSRMAWVTNRPHTAFLLWDNHLDAGISLQKLLAPQLPAFDELLTDPEPARILLVDDSPTARVKFRRLLQEHGYVVETAASADEALARTEEQVFDLAILDYFMPDTTGDKLCRRLRESPQSRHTLAAILTSTYHDKVISDSLAAGAVECMFKNEADELFLARVAAMSRTASITRRIEQDRLQLAGILASVGDGVYGVDPQGLISFANPAALRMLGYTHSAALIGKSPQSMFHAQCTDDKQLANVSGKHLTACYLQQAIKYGLEQRAVESVFTRSDGTPIQVELTIFPLRIQGQTDGAVVAFRDVSERKLLEQELKWQANHDQLTKLLNRKYMEDALEKEVQRLKRSREKSALLYIDLDRFKYINDTIGHAAGDQLLIEISQQLQVRLRQADLLGRLGGDEFAVLMHNIDPHSLFETADVFRRLLEDFTFTHKQRQYKINGSIGVALIDDQAISAGDVQSNADIACHIAKGKGRNQTHLYSPEQDDKAAMDLELGWSTRLRHALDNNSFKLVFQPIVPLQMIDTETLPEAQGALWPSLLRQQAKIHYEVLLRLPGANGEMISPNAYLPTAERFNMMQDIDKWVIRHALAGLAKLRHVDIAGLAINLSGQSMDSESLLPLIRECLEQHELDPDKLLFEITESSAITHLGSANRLITELHKLGCHFALDDFGTGYSSFSHLKHLPVDIIKIDGQFVKDIAHDPMDLAIVTSITNVAHSLGKQTIAEFVEDAATLRLLKRAGVDYVQGYYISSPLARIDALAGAAKASIRAGTRDE